MKLQNYLQNSNFGTTDCKRWAKLQLGLASILVIGGAIAAFEDCALAQISTDDTLGSESSIVTPLEPGSPIDVISGGATRGENLFHSFEQFSVPTGSTAYFNNALQIQNIISRVTGGAVSNIDGLLRANGTANLFLLNPNGIVFGPNAQLNIGGSFLASTASSLNFADRTSFSTTAPQSAPLLTISVPTGLQFGSLQSLTPDVQNPGALAKLPAGIAVQGSNLSVQTGRTLALVGGDVTIFGSNNPLGAVLTAGGIPIAIVDGNPLPTTPGGRIELGSVTQGNVTLVPTDRGFALSYAGIQNFGDIQLNRGAAVDTSGTGGGEIQIQARNLRLSEGSRIASFTLGSLPGGNIVANASESVELIGTGGFVAAFQQLANPTAGPSEFRNGLFTLSFGSGDAGAIEINTGRLIVRDGTFVTSSSFGVGQGGSLNVNASDSVEVIGSLLATGNRPGSTGAAGNLTINTRNLTLQDRAVVSAGTSSDGRGGTLSVNASELVELSGGDPFLLLGLLVNTNLSTTTLSTATAGDLRITTKKLIVRDGAYASADTFGLGEGGTLDVTASDFVEVRGTSADGTFPSQLSTRSGGSGAAGDVRITTDKLSVQNQASVSATSLLSGNAGNLEITARFLQLDNQGTLTAATAGGERGNIILQGQDLQLRRGSTITTNATGTAIGGNITINTNTLVALENSDITANASDASGGRVSVNTQGIFGTEFRNITTSESDITATSERGAEFSGTVEINTPDIDPSQGLVILPAQIVDASNRIATGCAAGGSESVARNAFITTGRGGLPPNPTQPLNGEAVLTNWATLDPDAEKFSNTVPLTYSARETSPTQIVEAQGWALSSKGEVILTASASSVTLNIPWMTPATCNT